MKETATPLNRCYACRYVYDATTDTKGEQVPHEGSISICLGCGAISVFQADLTTRPPTTAERARWAGDVEFKKIYAEHELARRQVMKNRVVVNGTIRKR